MNLSLTITGTASQLALVLASLPDGVLHPKPLPVEPVTIVPTPDLDDDGPVDANAPALDKDGLPWDARIHAKTKVLVSDGSWRKRRGVDDSTVAEVEAELRGAAPPMPLPEPVAMPLPEPVAMPLPEPVAMPLPEPVAMPLPEPVAIAAPPMPLPEPVAIAAPPMPLPEPVAIAAPPVEAAGPLDFSGFMQHLSGQMTKRDAGGLPLVTTDILAATAAEISTAFIAAGHIAAPLASITDIATNQAMIDYAVALLTRDGRW